MTLKQIKARQLELEKELAGMDVSDDETPVVANAATITDWTEEDEQGSTDAPSEKAGDEPLSQGDRLRKKYGRSSGRKTDFLVD